MTPVAGESWSARRKGDEVVLTGAGHVYMVDSGDAEGGLARTIEVDHGHLADLGGAIADVVFPNAGISGIPPTARHVAEADEGPTREVVDLYRRTPITRFATLQPVITATITASWQHDGRLGVPRFDEPP